MNSFKTIKLFAALVLLAIPALAQKGTIRGTVIDDGTGEALFGVTVIIKGTTTGGVTDFDGKFEIKADPGTYDIQASFVSYQTVTISAVAVAADEVTIIDQIRLAEDIQELAEVVVTAEAIRTTEEALLTVKKKSANLLDGISAASFRKIGDSDAAAAATRITGVSIEGGKYIYVRGLGDRYTKSILNGVDIPGLDPDRNTLQMDIFPTNVIDNILVMKSFTADLPADFTGGVVNIETKDFPDEKTLNLSVGLGFNPNMHFNSNYLTYGGSSTDWLGFDNGARDVPISSDLVPVDSRGRPRIALTVRPNTQEGQDIANILRSFDPNLSAMRQNSAMNASFGVSLGNQLSLGNNTLGYNVALTYKNTTEFYEGAQYGRYGLDANTTVTDLETRELQTGDFGVNNVLLGGLAGVAYKRDQSKFKLSLLHLQNGESKAGIFDYVGSDQGADFLSFQHNLEYSERTLTNLLLSGSHVNSDARWEVEWKVSPTRSRITDPDVRFTRYEVRGPDDLSITSEGGFPERIWRFLEEDNIAGLVGATREYEFKGEAAKLKFGAGNTYKQRDYEILNFQFIVDDEISLTGDPNELFNESNLWPMGGSQIRGTYFNADFLPVNPNQFDASINNTAVYVSNEFSPLPGLKAIIGLRAENYQQRYTGSNRNGDIILDNELVLDDLDFFPTANFIYSLNENQNFRVSYSRTIARPSFKEASFAEIIDPITGRTFVGSFAPDINVSTGETIWDGNIQSTTIDNFDIRWEIFQKRGQTISVSAFYKTFQNPIEIVQYVQAPNSFQPRNVGDGSVIGGEFEFRQSLGLISPSLDNLSINGNITIADSRIDINPTELESRLANARDGQTVKDTRDMAGQAPYIVNAGLSYQGLNNGLEAGLFYNVLGETLQFVGIADRPDIYSVPFHSLNFNANKTFGPDEKMRLGFKVSNVLGDKKEQVFQNFRASDQFFTSLNPGTTFSVSFRYSIF